MLVRGAIMVVAKMRNLVLMTLLPFVSREAVVVETCVALSESFVAQSAF